MLDLAYSGPAYVAVGLLLTTILPVFTNGVKQNLSGRGQITKSSRDSAFYFEAALNEAINILFETKYLSQLFIDLCQ